MVYISGDTSCRNLFQSNFMMTRFKRLKKVTKARHISLNAYINQALRLMNRLCRRHLRAELRKESMTVRAESLKVLKEFESI